MMLRLKKISGYLLLIIFLAACSKDKGDKTAPLITILAPANHQAFTAGQTIQVTVTASDNDKVTELHIHVTDKATGNLLRDIHSYPVQASGQVQDSFTAEAGFTYIIEIIAKDPTQNFSTLRIEV